MESSLVREIHTPGRSPAHNRIIWRYMSFSKLIKFLSSGEMYFPLLEKMTDIKDGRFYASDLGMWPMENQNALMELLPLFELRRKYFVNCWSAMNFESYALWKIYLGGEKLEFAVKTNVGSLRDALSFSRKPPIYEGLISYDNDFLSKSRGEHELIYTKKKFYQFENEYRLSIKVEDGPEANDFTKGTGIKIPVNLNFLDMQIYLSPFIDIQTYLEIIKMFKGLYNNITRLEFKLSEIQDK